MSPGCSYLVQEDFVPFLQVRALRPLRAPLPCVLLCTAHAAVHVSLPCTVHTPICTCPPHACPVSAAHTPPPSSQAHPYSTPACGSLALCPWGPPLLCGSLALCPRGAASTGWPRVAPQGPYEQWDGVDSSTPEPGRLDSDGHPAVQCQAVTDRVWVCRMLIPNAFLLPLAQFVQDFMLHFLEENLK